jgi:WSC domain
MNTVDSSSPTPPSNCQLSCAGNPAQYCGGAGYIELYNAPPGAFPDSYTGGPGTGQPDSVTDYNVATGYATTYQWYGCYNDTRTYTGRHILTGYANGTTGGGTVELCASQCAADNTGNSASGLYSGTFNFMGLHYYGECYCDQQLAARSNLVDPTLCDFTCDGNHAEFCGADAYMGIYTVSSQVPYPVPVKREVAETASPQGVARPTGRARFFLF